jgi:hypothetical protein
MSSFFYWANYDQVLYFWNAKNIIIFISSIHLMYHFTSKKQPFLAKQISITFQIELFSI